MMFRDVDVGKVNIVMMCLITWTRLMIIAMRVLTSPCTVPPTLDMFTPVKH